MHFLYNQKLSLFYPKRMITVNLRAIEDHEWVSYDVVLYIQEHDLHQLNLSNIIK